MMVGVTEADLKLRFIQFFCSRSPMKHLKLFDCFGQITCDNGSIEAFPFRGH